MRLGCLIQAESNRPTYPANWASDLSPMIFLRHNVRVRTRLIALVVACLLAPAAVVFRLAADTLASSSPHVGSGLYSLPSDGWKPGHPSMLALLDGRFGAKLTADGACGGLGSTTALWPVGYKVRFHPTELVNPRGAVVAHEGQRLTAAGGVDPPTFPGNRCGNAKQYEVITSPVEFLRGRSQN